MGMNRTSVAAVVGISAALLAACGGKPEGCTQISDGGELARMIIQRSTNSTVSIRMNSGWSVPGNVDGVRYVAYQLAFDDGDTKPAVWAISGSVDAPSGIRSVDGYAQQFTTWPTLDGANGSDSARAATACLD